MTGPPIRKPRCFLVYALAPDHLAAAEANRRFNDFVADPALPLALFHDHFIGRPGGVAIFFLENPDEQKALYDQSHLTGWQVEYRPLIFSYSPAAFDEQIAFTLKRYRHVDWERLQKEQRPAYGDPLRESETAAEAVIVRKEETAFLRKTPFLGWLRLGGIRLRAEAGERDRAQPYTHH